MTPIICTDVQRDNGSPLYTVKIYDIDVPSNFHSYDCIFFKQGRYLNILLEQAQQKIFKETPTLPSNLDEAAEISDLEANNLADDYIKFLAAGLTKNEPRPIGPRWMKKLASDRFKAGADFGAKKMLAKLRENCVIIDKDLYEIAMEGKFIEGKEEGIMLGKAEAMEDLPRWRKWEKGVCGNGQGIPMAIVKRGLNGYTLVDALGIQGEQYIMLSDLEKLSKDE